MDMLWQVFWYGVIAALSYFMVMGYRDRGKREDPWWLRAKILFWTAVVAWVFAVWQETPSPGWDDDPGYRDDWVPPERSRRERALEFWVILGVPGIIASFVKRGTTGPSHGSE